MLPKASKTVDLESGMTVTIHNLAYNSVLTNSNYQNRISARNRETEPDPLRFKIVLGEENIATLQDSKSNLFLSCPYGGNSTEVDLSETEHKWKFHQEASDDEFWFESMQYPNFSFYTRSGDNCPARMWKANDFRPSELKWRLFHFRLAPSDQSTKKEREEEEVIRKQEEISKEKERLERQQTELSLREKEIQKREEDLAKAEAAVRDRSANQSKQNLTPQMHDGETNETPTRLQQMQEEIDTLRLREKEREDAFVHSKTPFDLTNTGFGNRRFLHLKRL